MFKFVEMSHTYQDEIPGFDSSENLDKRFRNIHNLIKNKLNFRSPIGKKKREVSKLIKKINICVFSNSYMSSRSSTRILYIQCVFSNSFIHC